MALLATDASRDPLDRDRFVTPAKLIPVSEHRIAAGSTRGTPRYAP
jgi:hypothetical protein